MKFDILVENIINDLLAEGRMAKTAKYANIRVDSDKMLQKLNDGDFDIIIKSWSGNPRYANLSEETLKEVVRKVGENIKEMEPSSFSELRGNIESIVDEFYVNKGPKRKTYDERLTKAVTNLILHKEYDLISMGEPTIQPQTEEGEQKEKYDIENLSSTESAIYEFVSKADEPTSVQEVENQFPQSSEIVNSLIEKGFLERVGNNLVAKEQESVFTPVLDTDEEEDEIDPLSVDPDITSTFKNTFGKMSEDDFDYEGGSDYVPSWQR